MIQSPTNDSPCDSLTPLQPTSPALPIPGKSPTLTYALELMLLCILILLFYLPLLTQNGIPAGADLSSMLWPMRLFTLASITEFYTVPLWNPFTFMGMPYAATLLHTIYYPPTLLFQLIATNTLVGIKLELLFHLCLMACGTWWFVRVPLRLGAGCALFAGIVFACQLRIQYALDNSVILATYSYIPWCMGLVWLLLQKRIPVGRFTLIMSALIALQFLSGHPQLFLYTRTAEVLMAAGYFVCTKPAVKTQAACAFTYAAAGVASLALAAVQLIPTLELSPLTYRSIYKMQFGYPLQICHTPEMFLSYISAGWFENDALNQSSSHFAEYLLYIGLLPLSLATAYLVSLFVKSKRMTAILLIIGVAICLCFMLSANLSIERITSGEFTTMPKGAYAESLAGETSYYRYLSPLEVITKTLPLLDGMRAPSRFSLILNFMLIAMASLGLDFILKRITKAPMRNLLLVVVLTSTFANLYLPSMRAPFRDLVVPLEQGNPQQFAQQLREANPTRQYRLTTTDDERVQATLSPVWEERQSSMNQRIEFAQENLNVLLAQQNAEGYEEGLAPTIRTKDFLFHFNRHLRTPTPDPVILHLLGVDRFRADLPISTTSYESVRAISGTQNEFTFNKTASLAYWETQFTGIDWQELEGPYEHGLEPAYGRTTTLQTYGSAPAFYPTNQPLNVQFFHPGKMQITWQGIPQSSLLISMGQSNGWVVENEPLAWRNAIIAEVPLPLLEGREAITLEYKPRSAQLGLLVSAIALFMWSLLATLCLFTRKPTALPA